MKEEWKDIPGFNGKYIISNLGTIRSFAKRSNGRIMKQCKTALGYMTINLTDMSVKAKYRKFFVHRLVWLSFNGNIQEGYEVDHIDRVRDNNGLNNLRLLTIIRNRSRPGELNHKSIVTKEIVVAIRSEINLNQREIAKKYNLDFRHVNMIIKRKIWKCA